MVIEFFDQHRNVLAGFHFQHLHLLDRLFCRRIFVFAVQSVENLEIHTDTYCPAGHYFSYLIIVERGSAHRRNLRQEIGPLQPNSLLGQLALEGYLTEQRIELGRQIFVIGYVFQVAEYEHRRYGQNLCLLSERIVQRAGDSFDLQPGVLKLPLRLGHLEFDIKTLAMGNHAVFLEGDRILQMSPHSIHYLLAHFDDLSGQRQTVVSLYEFRNQCVTTLVSLFDGSFFIDFRGTVGRVDLAAHIDRQGYLPSDESETAVLQCQEPIRSHDRGEKLLNLRDQFGRDQPAAENVVGDVSDRPFQIVEVESDVLAQIGVGSAYADLRHAQADRCPPFLLGGFFFVTRGFDNRTSGEGDLQGFVQGKYSGRLLLSRQRCGSQQGEK